MPPLAARIDITQAPYSVVHSTSSAPDPTTVLDVNRLAIQAAIDACIAAGGGEIYAPAGWDIPLNKTTTPGESYGVLVNTTVPIVFNMEGVTLRFTRATGAGDFYGVMVRGGPVSFIGVTFSQRGMSVVLEQQHMVQVGRGSGTLLTDGAQRTKFHRCTFIDGVGGDGIRLLGNGYADARVVDTSIDDCDFIDCDRSGVSFQRGVERTCIDMSRFVGTGDQDIDFEPTGTGGLGQLAIDKCSFRRTAVTKGCMTLTGQGEPDENKYSVVSDCTFIGGIVSGRKLRNLRFVNNTIEFDRALSGADPVLGFTSLADDVLIEGNTIIRGASAPDGDVVEIAYDLPNLPRNAKVHNNNIVQRRTGHGIKLDSTPDASIVGNDITLDFPVGTPADTYSGIQAACSAGPMSGEFDDNRITCTATVRAAAGVKLLSTVTYKLGMTIASRNRVSGCAAGVDLRASNTHEFPPLLMGNILDCPVGVGGVASWYAVGGNVPGVFDAVGSVAPDGVITADIGSTYKRADTGAKYTKTSGTGTNTGWALDAGSPDPDLDVVTGSGSPEGTITAGAGTVYVRSDLSQIWIKSTGSGNTGWRWLQ